MLPYFEIHEINLGFFKIQIWGLIAAIAYLVAILLVVKEAKKRKLNTEQIYDLSFWIMLSSLIGARIGFIIENYSSFNNFLDILKIWDGGLAFYGGFLGAILAFYIYIKKKKLNFWKYADLFIIPLVIGHTISRVGCYITGDHLGTATNVPWAIMQQGQLRHPVILYELIGLVILLFILLQLKKLKKIDGFLFSSYVLGYAILRFFVSFFRAGDKVYYGLQSAQYIAIILFIIVLTVFIKKAKK